MSTKGIVFQSFTVPASGYATQVVYCAPDGSLPENNGLYHGVEELLIVFHDINTDSLLEVEFHDGSTWSTDTVELSTKGVYEPIPLMGIRGVRVRCKSGGTAGTAKAIIAWR